MLPESEITRREYFDFSTRPLGLQNMKFSHLDVNMQCDVYHIKLSSFDVRFLDVFVTGGFPHFVMFSHPDSSVAIAIPRTGKVLSTG